MCTRDVLCFCVLWVRVCVCCPFANVRMRVHAKRAQRKFWCCVLLYMLSYLFCCFGGFFLFFSSSSSYSTPHPSVFVCLFRTIKRQHLILLICCMRQSRFYSVYSLSLYIFFNDFDGPFSFWIHTEIVFILFCPMNVSFFHIKLKPIVFIVVYPLAI